jgi:hypothetical protein
MGDETDMADLHGVTLGSEHCGYEDKAEESRKHERTKSRKVLR